MFNQKSHLFLRPETRAEDEAGGRGPGRAVTQKCVLRPGCAAAASDRGSPGPWGAGMPPPARAPRDAGVPDSAETHSDSHREPAARVSPTALEDAGAGRPGAHGDVCGRLALVRVETGQLCSHGAHPRTPHVHTHRHTHSRASLLTLTRPYTHTRARPRNTPTHGHTHCPPHAHMHAQLTSAHPCSQT